MRVSVVYYSSSGNTARIAQAIAEAANAEVYSIDEGTDITGHIDLLFVGCGIYSGKPHRKMRAYIDQLDPLKVRNAAVFATYGRQEDIGESITRALQEKWMNVIGDPFVCRGQAWGLFNRGLPRDEELRRAKAFAEEMVSLAGRTDKIVLK